MSHNKILVTSALPYVNNVPHLGNMVCILSADIYTRYLRSQQKNVISVLGTDEHGTTSEVKAIEEGVTPKEITDKYFKIHKEIYDWFEFEFDCFGRTSDVENHEISTDIYIKLKENDFILTKKTKQFYDISAKRYLADRFIKGTCPYCKYTDAKGDQCDNCGKLLEPEELLNPISTISKTQPILKETEHAYIDLAEIKPLLTNWIEKKQHLWSENAQKITQGWLKEQLRERCITRDLKWGISVPDMKDKVFYSWFDAPIGYISITKKARKDWKDWWFDDKNVRLVQFMGKDNTSFHTILFPSFLLGTKQPYTLMDTISVNEYLNYADGKFSKSRGSGIFGDGAKDSGLCADMYRYYIAAIRPEQEDTVFDWNGFSQKINTELIANYANLVNRTLTFVQRFFDNNVPKITQNELELTDDVQAVTTAYEQIKLKDALKLTMAASKKLNQYFQEQKPWETIKNSKEKAKNAIANLVNGLIDVTILIAPVIPQTAKNVFSQIGIEPKNWTELRQDHCAKGIRTKTPNVLLEKITDEKTTELRERFKEKTEEQIFPLDLRVGKILEVKDHPNADSLYIEKVDMGNGEMRQIISGLKKHYSPEELIGKSVIIVCNLQPAKLRGEVSEGMLLAGEDSNKKLKVIFTKFAKPSTPVTVEGMKTSQKPITIQEFLKIPLTIAQKRVLAYDVQLKAKDESIVVDLEDGIVR